MSNLGSEVLDEDSVVIWQVDARTDGCHLQWGLPYKTNNNTMSTVSSSPVLLLVVSIHGP